MGLVRVVLQTIRTLPILHQIDGSMFLRSLRPLTIIHHEKMRVVALEVLRLLPTIIHASRVPQICQLGATSQH